MRRLSASLAGCFTALLSCLVLLAAGATSAEELGWQRMVLGDASFSAPPHLTLIDRTSDDVTMESHDGATRLLAFWWTPDGPLLGYDDIVSHEQVTVAGRQALLIHSRFPEIQSLKLVFDEPRANGQQFIILLESTTIDFSHGSPLFDEIKASMKFDGAARPAARHAPPSPVEARAIPLDILRQRFNADCEAIHLPTWTHPTRDEMKKRPQVHLRWAALCNNKRYPVFGLDFDYDPNGRTDDFFRPFYYDLLQANGRWPYSIVVPGSKLIVAVSGRARSELNLDYQEAPEFADPLPPATAAARTSVYLPSPDSDDVRLWLGPLSFEPPAGWEVTPDADGRTMRLASRDRQAEITVTLWPADRPMPRDGVESVRFKIVAGARAQRLLQKTAEGDTWHVFFDEPLADGSRVAVTYRTLDGPVSDLHPILELFYASFHLNLRAPGAPLLPTARRAGSDPFAGISMGGLMQ